MIYHILAYITAFLLGAATLLYLYGLHVYGYWRRRGIPYVEPSFPFGTMRDSTLQRKALSLETVDTYRALEGHRFGGIFMLLRPALMIRDPDLIKTVCIKDFSHFEDHADFLDEDADPLNGRNLLRLKGQKWKHMRIKLTPTFTSGKMKKMYQFVVDCGEELVKYLENPAKNQEDIEVKEILAKFTTDVIATCAFGMQVNSLKNPDAEFRKMGKKAMDPPSFLQGIKIFSVLSFPELSKWFGLSFTPKDVESFFRKVVKESMDYREKNNIVRHDFLQLLLQLKRKGKIEDDEHDTEHNYVLDEDANTEVEFTDDDLAAQAFIFFVGGYETSSTVLSFILYELAVNPDVQKRLQEEVDQALAKSEGKMTYQTVIQDMEYLDKVVSEGLRKYPPIGFTDRVCTKTYKIPDSDVTIPSGTVVQIPIYAIQHDPKFYPDPEKFDPERFDEDNKRKRFGRTFVPFADGPRMCIGLRFGLMQMKVCLASLVSKYEFKRCEKTKVPFEYDPKALLLGGKGGTWVKIVERTKK